MVTDTHTLMLLMVTTLIMAAIPRIRRTIREIRSILTRRLLLRRTIIRAQNNNNGNNDNNYRNPPPNNNNNYNDNGGNPDSLSNRPGTNNNIHPSSYSAQALNGAPNAHAADRALDQGALEEHQ